MAQIEFGSPEAKKVIEASKAAHVFAQIDWDKVLEETTVEEICYFAVSSVKVDGVEYSASAEAYDEEDAMEAAVEKLKQKILALINS